MLINKSSATMMRPIVPRIRCHLISAFLREKERKARIITNGKRYTKNPIVKA
jgi:hypothetical protein